MGLTLNGSTDGFRRTSLASAFTICGWFRRTGTGGGSTYEMQPAISISNGGSGATFRIGTKVGNPQSNRWGTYDSDTWSFDDLSSDTSTDWHFIAVTRTGTTWIGYLGIVGSALVSNTKTPSFTPDLFEIGAEDWDDWLEGECVAIKVWDAVLTADELETERICLRPVRFANLFFFNPCYTSADYLTDRSGQGNSFTDKPGASITDGGAPAVGWGISESGLLVPVVTAGGVTEELSSVMKSSTEKVAKLIKATGLVSVYFSNTEGVYSPQVARALASTKKSQSEVVAILSVETLVTLTSVIQTLTELLTTPIVSRGLTSPVVTTTNNYFRLIRTIGLQTAKPVSSYVSLATSVTKGASSVMKTLTEMVSVPITSLSLSAVMKTQTEVTSTLKRTVALQIAAKTASQMTSSPEVARALQGVIDETTNVKAILQIEGEIVENLISAMKTQTEVVASSEVARNLQSLVKNVTNTSCSLVLSNALKLAVSSSSYTSAVLSTTAAIQLQSLMKTVTDMLSSPNVDRSVRSVMSELSNSSLSPEVQRLLSLIIKSATDIYMNLTVTGAGITPLVATIRTLTNEVASPSIAYALKMASLTTSTMHASSALARALSMISHTDTEAIFNLYSDRELTSIANSVSNAKFNLLSGTGLSSDLRTQTEMLISPIVGVGLSGLFKELSDSYGILSTERLLKSLISSRTNAKMRLKFLSEQVLIGNVSRIFGIENFARKFIIQDIGLKL